MVGHNYQIFENRNWFLIAVRRRFDFILCLQNKKNRLATFYFEKFDSKLIFNTGKVNKKEDVPKYIIAKVNKFFNI